METVAITAEPIQLDQFLKLAGIVDTGGQVKKLIEDGLIRINDQPATERRKKLHHGDTVEIKGTGIWKVTGP
ncbi:MAG TPA: RNA-binding S4 domain-containing protein [Selenomonadales bacterium]|nr:RNA-binding S4 domain-containing protein [Selenomonadales bacterium]